MCHLISMEHHSVSSSLISEHFFRIVIEPLTIKVDLFPGQCIKTVASLNITQDMTPDCCVIFLFNGFLLLFVCFWLPCVIVNVTNYVFPYIVNR